MKLTRKKAIELCIELWTWCKKTGKRKAEWPEWDKYDHIMSFCWFCEYDRQMLSRYKHKTRKGCGYCPLVTSGIGRCGKTYFGNWDEAETPRTTKKYAGLFLKQIKSIEQGTK